MKSVLITGGTGSLGSALVPRLLAMDSPPERIVIYSRGEHLQEEMARKFNHPSLRFFIGDVRDESRLTMACHGIDTIFHAAALKVVPIAEYNPFECVMTNVHGAENVVRASINAGVRKVIAVSTDKGVNPINLYGATKLTAEKIFLAANNLAAGRCIYSVVRYGNVVGSRGSVLPAFRKMAAQDGPLTITHPEMTRFWIEMEHAVSFILYCASLSNSGRKIFVPKIPSIRITDLAEAIAPGQEIRVIGIRPGEKMHEVLMTEDESINSTCMGHHFVIGPNPTGADRFRYSSDSNKHFLTVEQIRAGL